MPEARCRLARRISAVWGKDPMVVVGSAGSGVAACWAARRSPGGQERSAAPGPVDITRLRTASDRVRGEPARSAPRPVAGREFGRDGVWPMGQAAGEGGDLPEFLLGEGQPAAQLWMEVRLEVKVMRQMLQRAGGADPQSLTQLIVRRLQAGHNVPQVGPPHITAVDYASGQHRLAVKPVQDTFELAGAPDQVHMEPVNGEPRGQVEVVAQRAEVGGQKAPGPLALGQRGVGAGVGGPRRRAEGR